MNSKIAMRASIWVLERRRSRSSHSSVDWLAEQGGFEHPRPLNPSLGISTGARFPVSALASEIVRERILPEGFEICAEVLASNRKVTDLDRNTERVASAIRGPSDDLSRTVPERRSNQMLPSQEPSTRGLGSSNPVRSAKPVSLFRHSPPKPGKRARTCELFVDRALRGWAPHVEFRALRLYFVSVKACAAAAEFLQDIAAGFRSDRKAVSGRAM